MDRKSKYVIVVIIGIAISLISWFVSFPIINSIGDFIRSVFYDKDSGFNVYNILLNVVCVLFAISLYLIVLLLIDRHKILNTEETKRKKLAKLQAEINKLNKN